MTDKLYLITEAQRNSLLNLNYASASELLQSLPMVDSQPAAWAHSGFNLVVKHQMAVVCSVHGEGYTIPLYTPPQALTTITADDVTDEMIDELARRYETYNTVEADREIIAALVNVYNFLKEQK